MTEPNIVDFGEITPEQLKEASRYSIEIHWSPDDNVFLATVPELPGTVTHGETPAEAAEMAAEAAALWLSAARHFGRPIPEPVFATMS